MISNLGKRKIAITGFVMSFAFALNLATFFVIHKKAEEECFKTLNDATETLNYRISSFIKGNENTLRNLANRISTERDPKSAITLDALQHSPFEKTHVHVRYYLPDGFAVTEKGVIENISELVKYDSILNGKPYISHQKEDPLYAGTKTVEQFMPVQINGKIVGMISIAISITDFIRAIDINAFHNDAHFLIIDNRNEDIILNTDNKIFNKLSDFSKYTSSTRFDLKDFIEDIHQGKPTQFIFVYSGTQEKNYAYAVPSSIENFTLMVIVNENIIFANTNALRNLFTTVLAIEFLLFILFATWSYKSAKHQFSTEINLERKLQQERKHKDLRNIISGLSGDYSCIIVAAPDTFEDKVYREETKYAIKVPGWQSIHNLQDRLRLLVDILVHPEDKEKVLEATTKECIHGHLLKERAYYCNYRSVFGGLVEYWQIKFTYTESEPLKLIIGIRNVDTETKARIQNEKHMAEQQEALEKAYQLADASNRAKTSFLNNISHDIRTPMNAIIGYTGLAISRIENKEQALSYLMKIKHASDHLLSLINDVLDISRIESGKMTLNETQERLSIIVRNLQDLLIAHICDKKLSFNVDLTGVTHDGIVCDKLRLNQMLLNILSNAIKYTPEGGKIDFVINENEIFQADYRAYEIRVKDTGIGMSAEFQKKIFDPFTRAASSTVSGIQGTGLGMSITKSIVNMMGGTIAINSKENEGAEIIINLTLKIVDENLTVDNATVKKEFNFQGKKILLVEDNPMNREIASEILTDSGFIVSFAEDGNIAVDKVRNSKPGDYNIILMDIQMPIMDGYTATKNIRQIKDKEIANIPIIAMTANAFEEDKRLAIAAGMNAHIAKPINITNLKELLSQFT